MTEKQQPLAPELMKKAPNTIRNPYMMNFFKALIAKKGEELSPDVMKKMLDDMYRLFEYMLGQNMIQALPEEKRQEYLVLTEDLTSLTYDKIGEVFDRHVPNYEEVMKRTMKQFTDIFMKNRRFDPLDYPVSFQEDE